MEKIMLIDGNSILYRAFYALPLLRTEKGFSNAVFGFANILFKAIDLLKPSHVAVAFDVSKKTFRNDIFADYKKNRKPMPEELREQIPIIKEMLKQMGICILEKEGLEGDDILGTIAHRFKLPVVIVTGDRDCFQLIDDSTYVCRTIKGVSDVEMLDAKAIELEYGLKPHQIIDLKALAGDSSDNIPGVSGIGPKTATELLKNYTTVENVFNNIDKISEKISKKLIENKDNAFISKQLATINCNVNINCTLNDMKFSFPFGANVYNFFEEYQMRSILNRKELWKENLEFEKAPECKIQALSCENNLIDLINQVKKFGILSIVFNEQFISFSDGKTEYLYEFGNSNIQTDLIFNNLKQLFETNSILKICFDIKSLMHLLSTNKIKLVEPYFDVGLARHLLDGKIIKNYDEIFSEYGLNNNIAAFSLYNAYLNLSSRICQNGVDKLYYNLELPLVSVLFEMEQNGVQIDIDVLNNLKFQYINESNEIKKTITELIGEFNINSPKQLSEVLFDKLKLPHNKKKSTGVDELEYIKEMHPVVPLILRYRKVNKFLSTYILGMEKHIDEENRIHTNYKQTLTATGRLSSTEPNLQNIPIRSEESKVIRSMFTASSNGNVLLDADYSQIELRLLAHFSNEPKLIEAFKNDHDIHNETASKIFNVESAKVSPEMRRIAKVVNFGTIYGISDFGLASDLGISPKEAKKYIDEFYQTHPQVKNYINSVIAQAKNLGYVDTLLGRKRKINDILSPNFLLRTRAERMAQNAPLQGSGADIIKLSMLNIFNRLKKEGLKTKLILQIHDELVFDCPKDELNVVNNLVKEEMENVVKLNVPLKVELSSAFRWSDAH